MPVKGKNPPLPSNTSIVVVDLRSSKGGIRIFEKFSGEYLSGVGTELAGNIVIVL